jgi:membrane protein
MSVRKISKQAVKLVTQALTSWIDDAAPSMGAALSYYTIFSMAPLLLIVMSIAGFVFGAEAARGELFGQLRALMGDEAAKTLESLLATLDKPGQSISASVVGFAFLLIGATSVFGELQNALDQIWRVPARVNNGGVWKILRARLLSLGMILGFAFLLMVSLVAGAAVSAVGKWWGPIF